MSFDRIAVDVDSTLYDFSTAAREGFLKLAQETGDKEYFRGVYHPWTEWRSPADACGIDAWLKVISMCHDDDVILKQRPFSGCVETLQALVDSSFELLYISNRATESYNATLQWLSDNDFPLEDQELVCTTEDKWNWLEECGYLIDDRPKALVEFVYSEHPYKLTKHGRKAFGLMYEYNRALTDIPNVYLAPTWAGLNYYLVRKGLLKEPVYEALEV